jgi:integrase
MPTASAIRRTRIAAGRMDFSPADVRSMLAIAPEPLRTLILLAVSTGLGPADIGRLTINLIDGDWLSYPRFKAGSERRAWLWPEVVAGMRASIGERTEGYVFRTRLATPWCTTAINHEFRKVLVAVRACL